jgi:hypothetical protein
MKMLEKAWRSYIERPINALGITICDGLGYTTAVVCSSWALWASFSLSLLMEKARLIVEI